jgi:tRNA threonylcarbamoyladenosine biosynthesis protein TsaE
MSDVSVPVAPATMHTASAEETRRLGRCIGAACRGNEVILLEGDLGSGKTTLAQGLAAGLGIAAPVISPTFIVLREYAGRLSLYHFDFYRLAGTERAIDLEFEQYLEAGGVCVMEWPSCAPEMVPAEHLRLELSVSGSSDRTIVLRGIGDRHRDVAAAARACWESGGER